VRQQRLQVREEERRVLRREEEPDDARGLDDSDSGGVLLCCGGELAPGVEVLRVSQPDLAECGRLQRLCLREGEGDAVEVGAEERVELRGERPLLGKEGRGWGSAGSVGAAGGRRGAACGAEALFVMQVVCRVGSLGRVRSSWVVCGRLSCAVRPPRGRGRSRPRGAARCGADLLT